MGTRNTPSHLHDPDSHDPDRWPVRTAALLAAEGERHPKETDPPRTRIPAPGNARSYCSAAGSATAEETALKQRRRVSRVDGLNRARPGELIEQPRNRASHLDRRFFEVADAHGMGRWRRSGSSLPVVRHWWRRGPRRGGSRAAPELRSFLTAAHDGILLRKVVIPVQ